MLTIRELIKTLYNALIQRMKKYRGNWEQNDPTADDYIKNRPFYTDETDKTIIIPKQQIEVASGYDAAASGGMTTIPLSPIIELVVGQSYDIVWNGKNYICTAYEFDGLGVVGNDSIMSGNDTGEPFFIAISKDMFGGAYIYAYTTGTHTVEVTTVKIVKIDKKYLPDLSLAPVATSGSYNDLTNKPTIYTDVVRYGTTQSLTAAQKKTGKTNIGAVGYDAAQGLTTANKTMARTNIGAVGYESQSLTTAQKTQARTNIGAVSSDEVTGVVKYNIVQNLTDVEKQQARENIGATDADETKAAIDDLSRLMSEPKDGIAFTDQVNGYTYIACMRDGNFVTYIGVKSIEVTTMPTKTEYIVGEYFDPVGMVVTATAHDGTIKEITDFICPSSYIVEDDTSIEITYVEGGITHNTTIPISVIPFDPTVVLIDFEYTANTDGTYTITDWKGTSNGEASTEIIIPENAFIKI